MGGSASALGPKQARRRRDRGAGHWAVGTWSGLRTQTRQAQQRLAARSTFRRKRYFTTAATGGRGHSSDGVWCDVPAEYLPGVSRRDATPELSGCRGAPVADADSPVARWAGWVGLDACLHEIEQFAWARAGCNRVGTWNLEAGCAACWCHLHAASSSSSSGTETEEKIGPERFDRFCVNESMLTGPKSAAEC